MADMSDLRRLAIETAASQIAQVTGSSADGYDLELTDGTTMAAVGSLDQIDWADDTWVTIERAGPTWQIVGIAPHKAG